ncbi:hypothetical protein ACFXA3_07265 [Streptomyces sp. NPDC059456]|uniref:hypothetical protein n=1 Tax=Streptomyces sp. NPDC059456 TaxID=3346838 RepID=UPI0036C1ADC6
MASGLSITAAAAEVGITTAVIYQRRKRDPAFAAAMDAAHRAHPRTPDPTPDADDWEAFFGNLIPQNDGGAQARQVRRELGHRSAPVLRLPCGLAGRAQGGSLGE